MNQEKTKGFEQLMTMKQVKDVLGVSYGLIYALVREGRLEAVKVTGVPVSRHEVDDAVQGLRFSPTEVRRFIQKSKIN
jgi:excisionase family DNA binding protein